jgi:glycosyltransferase involved in cell wall biosynthesis
MIKKKYKLYICAMNLHSGGGLTVLNSILRNLPSNENITLFLDKRVNFKTEIYPGVKFLFIRPTVLSRLKVELYIYSTIVKMDKVLFLGSLGPLLKLRGKAYVFLHNRYLIEKRKLDDFDIKTKIRILAERLWFTISKKNVDKYIVQSISMKSSLAINRCVNESLIYIKPINPEISDSSLSPSIGFFMRNKSYDFIYAASGDPHKNHKNLIQAWIILANEDIFPSLCLTFDRGKYADLSNFVEKSIGTHGIKIENFGSVSPNKMLTLYKKSLALIYPSLFESFGMPLIEAKSLNMPILASELDYVRDLLNPHEVFDPQSPLSIARAVKRYLGKNEDYIQLLDGGSFLKWVLKGCPK